MAHKYKDESSIKGVVPSKAIDFSTSIVSEQELLRAVPKADIYQKAYATKNMDGSVSVYALNQDGEILKMDFDAKTAKHAFDIMKRAEDAAKGSRALAKLIPESEGNDQRFLSLAFAWLYSETKRNPESTFVGIDLPSYKEGIAHLKRPENVMRELENLDLDRRLGWLNDKITAAMEAMTGHAKDTEEVELISEYRERLIRFKERIRDSTPMEMQEIAKTLEYEINDLERAVNIIAEMAVYASGGNGQLRVPSKQLREFLDIVEAEGRNSSDSDWIASMGALAERIRNELSKR